MNSEVSQLVVSLAQGKAAVANEAFASIMASKVNDALDERKVAVAASIYNTSKTEQSAE